MISSLLPPVEDEAAKRRRERFTPRTKTTTKVSASTGESQQASPTPATGSKNAEGSTTASEGVARDSSDKAVAENDGDGKKGGVGKAAGSGAHGADKDGKAEGVVGEDKEAAGDKQGSKEDARDVATMSESTDKGSMEDGDGDGDGGEGKAASVVSNGKSGAAAATAGNGVIVPAAVAAETVGPRDVDVYKRDIAWLRSAQGMVAEVGPAM